MSSEAVEDARREPIVERIRAAWAGCAGVDATPSLRELLTSDELASPDLIAAAVQVDAVERHTRGMRASLGEYLQLLGVSALIPGSPAVCAILALDVAFGGATFEMIEEELRRLGAWDRYRDDVEGAASRADTSSAPQEAGAPAPDARVQQANSAAVSGTWVARSGAIVGGYTLKERIAVGGFGEVWAAERMEPLYRRAAIKFLRRDRIDAEALKRFRLEQHLLTMLDDPCIARIYDAGELPDGTPYSIMEFVDGLPLDAWCDRHHLKVRERLVLFRRICSAVQYAHQNLVIHRDLKPANILVNSEGQPKLLDFGIAQLINPGAGALAAPRDEFGRTWPMTPEYASPEQVRGEPITTATDIYSLGVILYELMTGRRPYQLIKRLDAEARRIICEEDPQLPSDVITRPTTVTVGGKQGPADATGPSTRTVTPEQVSRVRDGRPRLLQKRLRGDVDRIVLHALHKVPRQRFETAKEFGDEIERHLNGFPLHIRRSAGLYRLRRFLMRNKLALIVASLLVIAGIAVPSWMLAVRRERQAMAAFDEAVTELYRVFGRPQLRRYLNSTDEARQAHDQLLLIAEAQKELIAQYVARHETESARLRRLTREWMLVVITRSKALRSLGQEKSSEARADIADVAQSEGVRRLEEWVNQFKSPNEEQCEIHDVLARLHREQLDHLGDRASLADAEKRDFDLIEGKCEKHRLASQKPRNIANDLLRQSRQTATLQSKRAKLEEALTNIKDAIDDPQAPKGDESPNEFAERLLQMQVEAVRIEAALADAIRELDGPDAAESAFGRARARLEALHPDSTTDQNVLKAASGVQEMLALFERDRGSAAAAREALEKSQKYAARMVESSGGTEVALGLYVDAVRRLIAHLVEKGEREEALTRLRTIENTLQELHPSLSNSIELAKCVVMRGTTVDADDLGSLLESLDVIGAREQADWRFLAIREQARVIAESVAVPTSSQVKRLQGAAEKAEMPRGATDVDIGEFQLRLALAELRSPDSAHHADALRHAIEAKRRLEKSRDTEYVKQLLAIVKTKFPAAASEKREVQ